MLSNTGDVEVVYLKDEEFLPHDVEVRLGTLVRFVNVHTHDSFEGSNQSPGAAYKVVIECKGLFYFSLDSIQSSTGLSHRNSKNYSNENSFTFNMSGKYQLTSPTFPKMKCIITVVEMETMPPQKALYFPTAKDKEKLAVSNTLILDNDRGDSTRLNNTDVDEDGAGNRSSFIHYGDGHDSESSSLRKSRLVAFDDEKDDNAPKRKAFSSYLSRRTDGVKSGSGDGGDDCVDGGDSDDEVDNIVKERNYFKSLKRNYVNVKSPVDLSSKRLSPKSPSKSPVVATPRRPSHTSPQHPPITIDIEDYSFSRSFVEVKTNQRIQFRLSKDVPLHAEHSLFGESTNKALRFEAPLLQQLEETSFTFIPKSGGEVKISCKIYPEMVCTVLVIADADLTSPRPSSAVEAELRLGKSVTKSSTLQLSLEQLHQRAGGGEWSESQSSFLDSDDMFSCSDSPEKAARRARSSWATLPTPTTPAAFISPSITDSMVASANTSASKDTLHLPGKKSAQEKDDHLFLRAYRRKFFTSDEDSRNNSDSSGVFSNRREESRSSNNKSRMKLNFRSDDLHHAADAVGSSDGSDSSDTLYHNALTPSKKKRVDLSRKVPQTLHHRNYTAQENKQSFHQNIGYEHSRHANSSKNGVDNAPQRHVLVIEEFAFKPNSLIICSGDAVEFCKASAEVSNVSLSCEGEFDSMVVDSTALLLSSREIKVSHTFCSVGVFTITNEVYNFMQCKVTVNRTYTPSSYHPDQAVSKPSDVISQSTAPRLIGSFITINKNSSPRTSPSSKPKSNEHVPDNKSPISAAVLSQGQSLHTVSSLFGSFANLDCRIASKDLGSALLAAAAPTATATADDDALPNGDDSDGKVSDTDENVNSSNFDTNSSTVLSCKEKKKLKSKLKKKLKRKKNKENGSANVDGNDDFVGAKESNECLPMANIVSDINEEVNVVGATVVMSPECLPLATGVPSPRMRDQDYFYMMLTASADLVAECDGDSESENLDHDTQEPSSYVVAPEPVDHPSNLTIQVVNAIAKPEVAFTTETSSAVDKYMDILTALPLALNNSGPPTAEAMGSVAAEAEAEVAVSSYTAPDTLVLDVGHSQPNAKKKKKKKKSKKKKQQVKELSAEGELVSATAGYGDDDDDDNDNDFINDEDEKAIDSVVRPEVSNNQSFEVPTLLADELLQDAVLERLAKEESQPFLNNNEISLAATAVPVVEENEVVCEEIGLDDEDNLSTDEKYVGKDESSLDHRHQVGSTEAEHIHEQIDPLSNSVKSLVSPPSPHPSPPSIPLPPVTPFSAQEKGYAPLTVDKTSTQLLRNALFSPVSSAKQSSIATPTSSSSSSSVAAAATEERRTIEVVDSANKRKQLHFQPSNDSDKVVPEEKGPTMEELTNSLHEFEDFFYTRWACFQSQLEMASTDERVVYLSGPSNEVESYHVYTKKTYSSGRKRSKKR